MNYFVAIPLYFAETNTDFGDKNSTEIAIQIWNNQTRYIGVGAMLVGGVLAFVGLVKPLYYGIQGSFFAAKLVWAHGLSAITRTERDIPFLYSNCSWLPSSLNVDFFPQRF